MIYFIYSLFLLFTFSQGIVRILNIKIDDDLTFAKFQSKRKLTTLLLVQQSDAITN